MSLDHTEAIKSLRKTLPLVVADTLPRSFPMIQLFQQAGAWMELEKGAYEWSPALEVMAADTLEEGGSYGAPEDLTLGEPSLQMKTVYVPVKFTGLAFEELLSGESRHAVDRLTVEMGTGMKAVNKKIHSQVLTSDGSTAKDLDGIPAWNNDSNTSLAGLDQSAQTRFQAAINSTSGAITETKLEDPLDTLRSRNGGYLEDFIIVTTPANARTIRGFSSAKVADANDVASTNYLQAFAGDGNANPLVPICFYDGIPVFGIAGATASRVEIMKLGEDGWKMLSFGGAQGFRMAQFREAEDSDNYKATIKWRGNLVCENPYLSAGAVTGLS